MTHDAETVDRVAKAIWNVTKGDFHTWQGASEEKREQAKRQARAALSAMPDIVRGMVKPLVWVDYNGVWFTYHSDGSLAYNFDTTLRNDDEPHILYVGQTDITTDDYWTPDEAKAAANDHHAAQVLKALGL